MTRKEYILIAKALAGSRPPQTETPEYDTWIWTVRCLANTLHSDNAGFNEDKFLAIADKRSIS